MSISSSMRRAEVEFDEHLRAAHVPARAVGNIVVDLARIGRRDRKRQPRDLSGRIVRNVDRIRYWAISRNIKWRAVWHDFRGAAERKLALLSEVRVDNQRRKSPRIGCHVTNAPLDKMLDVTIVLLEVMRSKKKTLRPENLAVPRHYRPPRSSKNVFCLKPEHMTSADRSPDLPA